METFMDKSKWNVSDMALLTDESVCNEKTANGCVERCLDNIFEATNGLDPTVMLDANQTLQQAYCKVRLDLHGDNGVLNNSSLVIGSIFTCGSQPEMARVISIKSKWPFNCHVPEVEVETEASTDSPVSGDAIISSSTSTVVAFMGIAVIFNYN